MDRATFLGQVGRMRRWARSCMTCSSTTRSVGLFADAYDPEEEKTTVYPLSSVRAML